MIAKYVIFRLCIIVFTGSKNVPQFEGEPFLQNMGSKRNFLLNKDSKSGKISNESSERTEKVLSWTKFSQVTFNQIMPHFIFWGEIRTF